MTLAHEELLENGQWRRLWLGGYQAASDVAFLRSNRIKAVIRCGVGAWDLNWRRLLQHTEILRVVVLQLLSLSADFLILCQPFFEPIGRHDFNIQYISGFGITVQYNRIFVCVFLS